MSQDNVNPPTHVHESSPAATVSSLNTVLTSHSEAGVATSTGPASTSASDSVPAIPLPLPEAPANATPMCSTESSTIDRVDAITQRYMDIVDAICLKYMPKDTDVMDPNDLFYERSKMLLPHLFDIRMKMIRQCEAHTRAIEAAGADTQHLAKEVNRLIEESHALAKEGDALLKLAGEKQRPARLSSSLAELTSSLTELTTTLFAGQTDTSNTECEPGVVEGRDQLTAQAEALMKRAVQTADAAGKAATEALRLGKAAQIRERESKNLISVLLTVDAFINELKVIWEVMPMPMPMTVVDG